MLRALREALSVVNLIWVLILAPMALLSVIEDFTSWRAVVFRPVALWVDRFDSLTRSLPILRAVPQKFLGPIYLAIVAVAIMATFWISVTLEARRQVKIAEDIDFGKVAPQPYGGSPVESLVEGGVGAMAAGWLGLSGPVGWAVALGVMGTMMAMRHSAVRGEAREHAAAQTLEIERRRAAYIESSVGGFVRRETRRLLIAALLATLIVAVSLVYPLARHS